MKNNSQIDFLTQLTVHNSSSLRVRAYADIEKECFVASNASGPCGLLSKRVMFVVGFSAAPMHIVGEAGYEMS